MGEATVFDTRAADPPKANYRKKFLDLFRSKE